jgi:hypothetical protein
MKAGHLFIGAPEDAVSFGKVGLYQEPGTIPKSTRVGLVKVESW